MPLIVTHTHTQKNKADQWEAEACVKCCDAQPNIKLSRSCAYACLFGQRKVLGSLAKGV